LITKLVDPRTRVSYAKNLIDTSDEGLEELKELNKKSYSFYDNIFEENNKGAFEFKDDILEYFSDDLDKDF
ncbi:3887_t:CDS:2, partial [Funneliformis mosseae]